MSSLNSDNLNWICFLVKQLPILFKTMEIIYSIIMNLFYYYEKYFIHSKRYAEKCPSQIVLRQKNARKFKRLFHFYQLIPLHTQKDVWRLRHDPTYAPNCRTLKESRTICCRILGFHRLITSKHSTHTHTHARARHDARR